MANSKKTSKANQAKSINLVAVLIAIAVVIALGFGIGRVIQGNSWKNASKAEDIQIKDSDSQEVKVEKIQAKIDLLRKDIEKLQGELKTETEKMQNLYQEYTTAMAEYQIGTTTNQ